MYCLSRLLIGTRLLAATAVTAAASTSSYVTRLGRIVAARITESPSSSATATTATAADRRGTRCTAHNASRKRPTHDASLLRTASQRRLLTRRLQSRLLQHTTQRLRLQATTAPALVIARTRRRERLAVGTYNTIAGRRRHLYLDEEMSTRSQAGSTGRRHRHGSGGPCGHGRGACSSCRTP